MAHLVFFAALFMVLPFALFAQAVPRCAERALIVDRLEADYRENQRAMGVTNGADRVIEVWAASNGSWSLLVTRPDGVSCFLASGQGWTPGAADFLPLGDEG